MLVDMFRSVFVLFFGICSSCVFLVFFCFLLMIHCLGLIYIYTYIYHFISILLHVSFFLLGFCILFF